MAKWNVILSTTEPHNYVGIIQVRQGNRNSETIEAVIVENGLPVDLTGCSVYFESFISGKHSVQQSAKIIDAVAGKVQYTFDEYSMQSIHRQTANFIIFKGEDLIATTQDFSYFVIRAVSKTEGEMGSYWQTVEDLIADMVAFLNENKGDFNDWMNSRKKEFDDWRKNQQDTFEAWRDGQESEYLTWFESIKAILAEVDPGGTLLLELMDARVDLKGVRHDSISDRLAADLEYIYEKLHNNHYTIHYGNIEVLEILKDDNFSVNHEVKTVGSVEYPLQEGALIIATIDDPVQDTFYFKKVGEVQ